MAGAHVSKAHVHHGVHSSVETRTRTLGGSRCGSGQWQEPWQYEPEQAQRDERWVVTRERGEGGGDGGKGEGGREGGGAEGS